MQCLKKPEIVVLKGEEAVEALNNYISELREPKGEELTKEQSKAMIKLAECLIATIENEPPNKEDNHETPQIIDKLKKTVTNGLSKILQEPSPSTISPSTISSTNHLTPPTTQQIQKLS